MTEIKDRADASQNDSTDEATLDTATVRELLVQLTVAEDERREVTDPALAMAHEQHAQEIVAALRSAELPGAGQPPGIAPNPMA